MWKESASFNRLFTLFILSTIFLQFTTGFIVKKQEQRKKEGINIGPLKKKADETWEDQHLMQLEPDDVHGQLAAWIRAKARPHHLPIRYPRTRIDIHVTADLYQIVDLDQRSNLATVSAYLDVWWVDEYLPWNRTTFGGLSRIFVPIRWIWKPEFYMYHSVQGRTPDYASDATADIRHDGRVRMFVPLTARSLCPVNVKMMPFDEQNCSFYCGSWTYQSDVVRLLVEKQDMELIDFFDNQEWLLTGAYLSNGTIRHIDNESFSMVTLNVQLKRQSFYYVFNLVFPTTLVSLVAVIGFHAPINATGRRESKFRLGIMTLLSMSVMLLMLVGEMKFAMESVPGQRGSFSDLPLLGIYYMTLILIISVATCTTSIFVHLEKYALRNPSIQAVPSYLRWLAAKKLFCCYVPKPFRFYPKGDQITRNNNVTAFSMHSSPENTLMRNLIPKEVNFTEINQDQPITSEVVLDAPAQSRQRLDLIIGLIREIIQLKERMHNRGSLTLFWERILKRLETTSLCFYLMLIAINLFLFLCPELWY